MEIWLTSLALSKKSKQHIRSLMKIMFDCAMRWELYECGINPMTLARVMKATAKLIRVRYKLTVEQLSAVLANLDEPYRTMAIVAVCMGLRASEIAGLQ